MSAKKNQKSNLREWLKTLTIGILAVLVFRGMVAQAYQIPSGSMERTLLVGDYIYINKMLYGPEIDLGLGGHRYYHHRFPGFRKPERGDIIVFRYPVDLRKDFIKRCVAVEGQTVEVKDKTLYVDGKKQVEPYVIRRRSRPVAGCRPARQLRTDHRAEGPHLHDGGQPRQQPGQPLLGSLADRAGQREGHLPLLLLGRRSELAPIQPNSSPHTLSRGAG